MSDYVDVDEPRSNFVATDHVTFEQGALSPLGWPYCQLCFKPLNTEDCWRDEGDIPWDVCVRCHNLEAAASVRRAPAPPEQQRVGGG